MFNVYDNWERLVDAVFRREHDLELALAHSRDPSIDSAASSSLTSQPDTPVHEDHDIQIVSSSNTAAETDWKRLLPSDYKRIISRAVNPVVYATKKELFSRLCDSPILLRPGDMSFQLEKTTGKKCYMIGAKALDIVLTDLRTWMPNINSRFSQAVELSEAWLSIRGRIKTKILSPKTRYAAYLVFNLSNNLKGLGSARASVWFIKQNNHWVGDEKPAILHLHLQPPMKSENGKIAMKRSDGWMEVRLGSLYNNLGDNLQFSAWFSDDNNGHLMSGLIVEGIEFRPTTEAEEIVCFKEKCARVQKKRITATLRIPE